MFIRNLYLFFADDRNPPPGAHFIQMNDTPLRWESHCRQIIEEKLLEVDLLSGDINFDQDVSDPGHSPDYRSERWNSAGLAHTLTGLARRKSIDEFGNQLPLSWELRSVAPQLYANQPDAIRLYGLLRSLAARPLYGESLEDCIWREYEQIHGNPPAADRSDWDIEGPNFVFSADLSAQRSRGSNAAHAVERLLPRWRILMLDAISRRHCIINHKAAMIELERLEETSNKSSDRASIPHDIERRIHLPIGDREGRARYGIDLFSIFADRVFCDPATGQFRLSIGNNSGGNSTLKGCADWCETGRVYDWYASVTEAARSPIKDSSKMLARTCAQTMRLLNLDKEKSDSEIEGADLSAYVNKTDSFHRAMIYCCLCAYRIIMFDDINFGPKHIEDVFRLHSTTVHTWGRDGLENHQDHFKQKTPARFGSALRQALTGETTENLGDGHWEWIREGLQEWLSGSNNATLQTRALRFAPELKVVRLK